jgi:chemotaxis protein MotB
MAVFADLMTLLLCFFVMLVAMAELDALKYKIVVRSVADAFGVDRPEIKDEIVEGTSVIKQTFSSAAPTPTPLSQVRQAAQDDREALKIEDAAAYRAAKLKTLQAKLQQALANEIRDGHLSVETMADRVLIRIDEHASFPSASANLKPAFLPVLKNISAALSQVDGQFVVSGHTDNVPLSAGAYRSNWELSAARATSVVHALLAHPVLQPEQFRIEGYADTRPLTDNRSAVDRAKNRRVEIGIIN